MRSYQMKFKMASKFEPAGDQPKAIEQLVKGINENESRQTLLGVTGSGKTFTMAKVIEKINRPALIISHNKTLAAQLYREFKEFFPENAVEYFVSYYDYYQPEAYVVSTDTYIEKDSSINDEIDRLRLAATASLLDRRDTIIVATVSCIYGLGSPEEYRNRVLLIKQGLEISRKDFLSRLVDMQYERKDAEFERSTFRVKGDVVEIHPAYSKNTIRVEFFGDEIDRITELEAISGKRIENLQRTLIYPAKHFLTSKSILKTALKNIEEELNTRLIELKAQGKELEAHRLESRTRYDMEMISEIGYCNGIENYSRHLTGRQEGDRPAVLLDYFPDNFITFVDESHVTLPQIRGMYNGDRARKQNLVEYGFRLPSALDNRPLYFEEFDNMIKQSVFVSATPGDYETGISSQVVEQIIRPTGLVDPEIEVRSSTAQVDDLIAEVNKRVENNERVIVTTLTKKMSEDLSQYLAELGIKVTYLHSEIETIERVEILRDLRRGEFDVLVGINLLREGIDLPEVSLVCILDADKVGFLRSTRSLIQTAGRAARHINGKVIMYADRMSDAMQETIDETNRRREIQLKYNEEHGITPRSVEKAIGDILERKYKIEEEIQSKFDFASVKSKYNVKIREDLIAMVEELEKKMYEAAENLDFEKAANIRDVMKEYRRKIRA